MKVLVTSTNEEDPSKIEGATVAKTLNIIFFKHSRAANSAVKGWTWLKFNSSNML